MKSFNEWQKTQDEFDLKPPKPNKIDKNGGYAPTAEQKKIFKKVDLITLPAEITGTNCANCKFIVIDDKKAGTGFCTHKNIKQWVTAKMCCAFWDHANVKRSWEQ